MSAPAEPKSYNTVSHDEKGISQVEDSSNLDQNAKVSDYKAAAIEAENVELNMSVPQAVRQYPMAALWAFIMCCTIVQFSLFLILDNLRGNLPLTESLDHGVLLRLPDG